MAEGYIPAAWTCFNRTSPSRRSLVSRFGQSDSAVALFQSQVVAEPIGGRCEWI